MCSTVTRRRFRVRTRGAIREPNLQTNIGSPRKKQPHHGCGFCFKDKATHTRRIIITMTFSPPHRKDPKNNPYNKQRHYPKRCYSSKGKRSTAARASDNSPIERWPNSPTQSEHKRCDNIVGSGGNDPRQVWTASPHRQHKETSGARQ